MKKIYESGLVEFFGSYDNNMLNYLIEEYPLGDGIVVMNDGTEITTEEFIDTKLS